MTKQNPLTALRSVESLANQIQPTTTRLILNEVNSYKANVKSLEGDFHVFKTGAQRLLVQMSNDITHVFASLEKVNPANINAFIASELSKGLEAFNSEMMLKLKDIVGDKLGDDVQEVIIDHLRKELEIRIRDVIDDKISDLVNEPIKSFGSRMQQIYEELKNEISGLSVKKEMLENIEKFINEAVIVSAVEMGKKIEEQQSLLNTLKSKIEELESVNSVQDGNLSQGSSYLSSLRNDFDKFLMEFEVHKAENVFESTVVGRIESYFKLLHSAFFDNPLSVIGKLDESVKSSVMLELLKHKESVQDSLTFLTSRDDDLYSKVKECEVGCVNLVNSEREDRLKLIQDEELKRSEQVDTLRSDCGNEFTKLHSRLQEAESGISILPKIQDDLKGLDSELFDFKTSVEAKFKEDEKVIETIKTDLISMIKDGMNDDGAVINELAQNIKQTSENTDLLVTMSGDIAALMAFEKSVQTRLVNVEDPLNAEGGLLSKQRINEEVFKDHSLKLENLNERLEGVEELVHNIDVPVLTSKIESLEINVREYIRIGENGLQTLEDKIMNLGTDLENYKSYMNAIVDGLTQRFEENHRII